MRLLLSALCISILFINTALAAIETPAKSALLIEAYSGQVLYEKAANIPIPPASMSKMMTIYVIFDALKRGEISMSDRFTISETAWRQEGSRMFLNLGDSVSVENLLKGAIIQSGNDACVALAEGLSGSIEGFVIQMNAAAEKLGLSKSHFANPTGLPDPEHYMSVTDLASLGRALITEFPKFYPLYAEKNFTWNKISQSNRNPLLLGFKGADGIKTGHTEEAGYCLVGSAQREGMRLISVVAGLDSTKARNRESRKLLGYGFSSFTPKTLSADKVIAQLPLADAAQNHVNVYVKDAINFVQKKNESTPLQAQITYQKPLQAPLKAGDVVGRLSVTLPNGTVKYQGDLVIEKDIDKAPLWDQIVHAIKGLVFGPVDHHIKMP